MNRKFFVLTFIFVLITSLYGSRISGVRAGSQSSPPHIASQQTMPQRAPGRIASPALSPQVTLDYTLDITSTATFTMYLPIAYNNYQSCTAPPTLISPPNGSNLDTIAPLFVFDGGNNHTATYLRLVVATDPGFTHIVTSLWRGGMLQGVHQFRDSFNFAPSTTYYWRTFFICGDVQGTYSEAWSFITGSGGTILPRPNLISPANGATVSDPPVTLQWSAVPGAVEYLVFWHGLGQGIYYQRWVNNTQTTISWLDTHTTYEWWVSARNDYAIGTESVKWQFIVPAGSLSSPRVNHNFMLEDGSTHQIFETGNK